MVKPWMVFGAAAGLLVSSLAFARPVTAQPELQMFASPDLPALAVNAAPQVVVPDEVVVQVTYVRMVAMPPGVGVADDVEFDDDLALHGQHGRFGRPGDLRFVGWGDDDMDDDFEMDDDDRLLSARAFSRSFGPWQSLRIDD